MKKNIHFIGIGGTGLSAIARVLLEKGYSVSGSDRNASPLFKAIGSAGAKTFLGHAAEQIAGADLVIRSSAISDDNPEVIAARDQGIPVIKRADFLEELTKDKETIAIAGSHGKTTTTAILIWILSQLGTQPSFISGGVINQLDTNAQAGSGPYFVIEADEYDYMFLGLSPRIAIVTNIEHDHPDCFPTKKDYFNAFKSFLERVQTNGQALLCTDDHESAILFEEMQQTRIKCLGYGTSPSANYRVENSTMIDGFPQFNIRFKDNDRRIEKLGTVNLKIPGHHNVLNATAALSVVHQLGLPIPDALEAVKTFKGAGRRFEIIEKINDITVIDDYGHHPTQLAATLEAARTCYSGHRIWAVWQPHTYSRTQLFEKEYIKALQLADKVIVLKVYAAREKDPGYSAEVIVKALPEEKARYIPDFLEVEKYLVNELKRGDILLFFSAGDATEVSKAIVKKLAVKGKEQDPS